MAAVTRAAEQLRQAGIAYTLHEYAPAGGSHRPDGSGRRDGRHAWGLEAAEALGVDPARLFKTLVATVDEEPVFAMVPVEMELDLGALAVARAGRRAALADPAAAERLTGYQLGGISPLGSRRPLPVVVHEDAVLFDTILLSAGRRGLQLEVSPQDLLRMTDGKLAPVARPR
jgi:Cys-tRNA(Pro)/Cys-tRNA(Cys) deacylase